MSYGKFHGHASKSALGYDFAASLDRQGILHVDVSQAGKDVAEFQFTDDDPRAEGKLYPLLAEVEPAHRRKGIATQAYGWVKALTGMELVPSGHQSADAKKFWSAKGEQRMREGIMSFDDVKKAAAHAGGKPKSSTGGVFFDGESLRKFIAALKQLGFSDVSKPTNGRLILSGDGVRVEVDTEMRSYKSKMEGVLRPITRLMLGLNEAVSQAVIIAYELKHQGYKAKALAQAEQAMKRLKGEDAQAVKRSVGESRGVNARSLSESTQRHCFIYKAKDGNYYMELAGREYGERDDATTYGPFPSEDAAWKYVRDNFSNPGGSRHDDSGKLPVPHKSPDGSPVVNPRTSRGRY